MNGQEGNEEQVGTADASSVDGAANSARTGTPSGDRGGSGVQHLESKKAQSAEARGAQRRSAR